MNNKLPSTLLALPLVISMLLTGCQAPLPSSLANEQVTQVVENILTSFNAGDYADVTKHMSTVMVKAFPEAQFLNMVDWLRQTCGAYQSCDGTQIGLSDNAGYAVYRLPCRFELETVTVSVAFLIAGSQVEGLYFDSPNLRRANEATPSPGP